MRRNLPFLYAGEKKRGIADLQRTTTAIKEKKLSRIKTYFSATCSERRKKRYYALAAFDRGKKERGKSIPIPLQIEEKKVQKYERRASEEKKQTSAPSNDREGKRGDRHRRARRKERRTSWNSVSGKAMALRDGKHSEKTLCRLLEKGKEPGRLQKRKTKREKRS